MRNVFICFMSLLAMLLWGTAVHATIVDHSGGGICLIDGEIPDFDSILSRLETVHKEIHTNWNEVSDQVESRTDTVLNRHFPWTDWEFPVDLPEHMGSDLDELCSRLTEGLWHHRPEWDSMKEDLLSHLKEDILSKLPCFDGFSCDINASSENLLTTPEPGSILLLTTGLAGLLILRRTRKK